MDRALAWLREQPISVQDTLVLAAALFCAAVVHAFVFALLGRAAKRTRVGFDDALLPQIRAPIAVILPVSAIQLVLPALHLDEGFLDALRHLLSVLQIAGVAWLLIRLSRVLDDLLLARFRHTLPDRVAQRRVTTQLRVLHRVFVTVIAVVALAAILMTFPRIRQFGTSLMASAGIAGLVVGIAARPMVSNLISGIQIAITQPLRLDDEVVIAGEFGRVEEITSTYVVVVLWDGRRLVVPLNWFESNVFQNWTRTGAGLLGAVMLYVDHAVCIDDLRRELARLLEASPKWDRRVGALQVTNVTERSVELRALVSAKDSGTNFELRCEVREKLLAFLRDRHPEALPRVRAFVSGLGNGDAPGGHAVQEEGSATPAPGAEADPPSRGSGG